MIGAIKSKKCRRIALATALVTLCSMPFPNIFKKNKAPERSLEQITLQLQKQEKQELQYLHNLLYPQKISFVINPVIKDLCYKRAREIIDPVIYKRKKRDENGKAIEPYEYVEYKEDHYDKPKFEERLTNMSPYEDIREKFIDFEQSSVKALKLAESNGNSRASSGTGALGWYMFTRARAEDLGLKRDNYIDERLDPEKSSKGLNDHLEEITLTSGRSLEKTLLIHLMGMDGAKPYLQYSGEELFNKLPKIYKGNRPKDFIVEIGALKILLDEGLLIYDQLPLYTDEIKKTKTIKIKNKTKVTTIAKKLNISKSEVIALNPEIKGNYIPSNYLLNVSLDVANH